MCSVWFITSGVMFCAASSMLHNWAPELPVWKVPGRSVLSRPPWKVPKSWFVIRFERAESASPGPLHLASEAALVVLSCNLISVRGEGKLAPLSETLVWPLPLA